MFEQLEWSMKLWWPHCEALVALLLAYSRTRRPQLLRSFLQVYDYTFSQVSPVLPNQQPALILTPDPRTDLLQGFCFFSVS